jgi:hypothetical protein
MMIGKIQKQIASAVAAATLVVLAGASGARAVCVGDCNSDGQVLINEVVSAVNIFLENANVSTCGNADQNGDGQVLINEVVGSVNSFLDPSTCPMVQGGTPTPTTPAGTSTPTRTATKSPSPSPTPTATLGAQVCGNGVKEGDEDCDDGGVCTGGDNAGTPCTAESDCTGEGVCDGGTHIGRACDTTADCPNAACVHCRPFGGDGCAANCTSEVDVPITLVAGATKACKGGANDGKACAVAADCPSPGTCSNFTACLGGTKDSMPCATNADCDSNTCTSGIVGGTSAAFVHGGILQLPLPLSGMQTLTIGKMHNGQIPGVIKASSVRLPRIAVGVVACACVRGVAAKTCGGTLTNADGSISDNCTPDFTAGDSVCAGKKPCAFVNGPGNSTSGVIGCDGLTPVNLSFTQDGGGEAPPMPPTPPPNAGPAVIELTGTGPAGSALLLNTSAIGQATGSCTAAAKCAMGQCAGGTNSGKSCTSNAGCPLSTCVGFGKACTKNADCPGSTCSGVNTLENAGPDLQFCNNVGTPQDDDPFSTRGVPQTLPQVTGVATGEITNTLASSTHQIGPFSYTGSPYTCANLMGANPTASGSIGVGAFTSLNQVTLGDIVVRNRFVTQ